MENNEFLKYFINEDLYLVEADKHAVNTSEKTNKEEVQIEKIVSEILPIAEEPIEVFNEPSILSYKGANEKGILILVEDSAAEFLNENDLSYLLKIIGAVKLSLEDVALVNLHKSKNYSELDYSTAIVFTPNHFFKSPNSNKYSSQQVGDVRVLLADPLDLVAKSVELRTNLWNALKGMFN